MQIESFDTLPLQQIIPSYAYDQFSDDEAIQAFVSSFNGLAQGYLDFFNSTPLSVYTSPNISGALLDWIGQGIYGIERPIISSITSTLVSSAYNTAPYNVGPYGVLKVKKSGSVSIVDDDIYKRTLTWH